MWECGRLSLIRVIGGIIGLGLCEGEQLASAGDVVAAGGFGQQAIVADAVEALRQDMDEEAADELADSERHQLVPMVAFDPVVLPPESDAGVVERNQTAVGDGDTVGIAREIGQHCLRAPNGRFE